MPQPLRFKLKEPNDFAKVLRSRVNDYFKANNKNMHADAAMITKTVVQLSLWIGAYLFLILGTYSLPVMYLIWAVLGVSIALVTVNIGHDAIHGSYSGKQWVNQLLSHTFNFNGASAYMWKNMHNVAHHTYTNVHGYDEDISPVSLIRLSPSAELKKIHKHQAWYSFILYSFATLSWIFSKDYIKFFKNEVGNFGNRPHPKKEYFYLFFYKAICYTLFLVLPILLIQQPIVHILLGFVVAQLIAGFYLAIVFMLAHAVEGVNFPLPKSTGIIENDWAIHQLYTTANFCTGSKIAAFLTGGLNQQVEHHLFPNMCSTHYPAIAKIVQETAAEYHLPYYDKPGFLTALRSHVQFMYHMGREKDYSLA